MTEFGYNNRISVMLQSSFESIPQEVHARFRDLIRADVACVRFPELLTAEEAVLAFPTHLGRSLLQAFVEVRVEQALAARPHCACGRPLPVLHSQDRR